MHVLVPCSRNIYSAIKDLQTMIAAYWYYQPDNLEAKICLTQEIETWPAKFRPISLNLKKNWKNRI